MGKGENKIIQDWETHLLLRVNILWSQLDIVKLTLLEVEVVWDLRANGNIRKVVFLV